MDDHVSVAVVHGRDDLLKKTTSFAVLDLEDTTLRTRLGCRCYEGTCGNGRGKVCSVFGESRSSFKVGRDFALALSSRISA